MKTSITWLLGVFIFVGVLVQSGAAQGIVGKDGDWTGPVPDEFKIKREQVFEFAKAPTVTRAGDTIKISFATKGFCDVTVAIEKPSTTIGPGPKIVRHLASGILGPNAPEPFKKNAKEQTIVWDGKDDQGTYIDDKDSLSVRVSLGLKAKLERTLLWSPHKQRGSMPLLAPSPEGVLVFDGTGVDYVRLFDHDGNYVRTIYPFPAGKIKDARGVRWVKFPQGYRRPLKEGIYQHTMLTSGVNDSIHDKGGARHGVAAKGMAVRGNRIALAYQHLNRLSVDGATDGLPLKGPETSYNLPPKRGNMGHEGKIRVGPSSLAFSPDGKTLYLTGYLWSDGRSGGSVQAVMSMDYEKNDKPTVFVGSWDQKKYGKANNEFSVPTSVACGPKGNVYVTDFLNHRVQVFDPAGKHLKSIPAKHPAKVCVHQKTGAIYVFSWSAKGISNDAWRAHKHNPKAVKTGLATFSPYPECKKVSFESFPFGTTGNNRFGNVGQQYHVELDSWAPGKDPVFWVMGRVVKYNAGDYAMRFIDPTKDLQDGRWLNGVKIMKKKKGKWTPTFNFGEAAKKKVKRINYLKHNIQELFVNPANGKLYVGEPDSGPTGKAYNRLIEINPETGKTRFIQLPFNPEEIVFDLNGMAYLRSTDVVVRYDSRTWREIPWDYGEEMKAVSCAMGGRSAKVLSGIRMPSIHPVCFHQSGMGISPRGHLVVACGNKKKGTGRQWAKNYAIFGVAQNYGTAYEPTMYPGRERTSTSCCVHIWDRHGKLVHEDAVMGLPQLDGVHIDKDDNIYVLATPTRVFNGKRYFNYMSETLMKFKPRKGKIVRANRTPIPLNPERRPKRSQDVSQRWCEGAEWFYGGVGFAGFNTPHAGGGCACWYVRFDLDKFARSFVPEPDQFSVAVLDTNGNLLMRIGQYGNVDDGVPMRIAERGVRSEEPPNQRSIGGDEVALFHPCYVATHTDRRLFVADLGNARIVSVKLDYHTEKTTALKDVRDTAK